MEAIDEAPEDALVLWKCLKVLCHYATPVAEGYASEGPTNAIGRAAVARGLVHAQRRLEGATLETRDERVLFFYARQIEALWLMLEPPTPEQLARAAALLDAVLAVQQRPEHDQEEQDLCDWTFRYETLARRRAWELVFAGEPYGGDSAEKLAIYTTTWDRCLGWPIRPLVVEPAFQAWAKRVLAERAAAGTHPPVAEPIWLSQVIVKCDQPTPDELRGRMLYLCTKGMNLSTFGRLAKQCIEDRLDDLLGILLSLGYAPDDSIVDDDQGHTLLHAAVAANNEPAVRALVAAGADPDRKSKPGKRSATAVTPRSLADKAKRPAMLQALEPGSAEAPRSDRERALAGALRDANAALSEAMFAFFASSFGRQGMDRAAFLDRALRGRPETVQQLFADAEGTPFDKWLLAVLVHRAGLGADVARSGRLAIGKDIIVAGDFTCEGSVIDELGGGSLIVAGNASVGSLITEADCLVGGDLIARDLIWGNYNDCALVVGGTITAPVVVATDHTCEARGEIVAQLHLEDPSNEELAKTFVAACFDDGEIDRGRVVKLVKAGKPIIRGGRAQPSTSRKLAAKPKPKTVKGKKAR